MGSITPAQERTIRMLKSKSVGIKQRQETSCYNGWPIFYLDYNVSHHFMVWPNGFFRARYQPISNDGSSWKWVEDMNVFPEAWLGQADPHANCPAGRACSTTRL